MQHRMLQAGPLLSDSGELVEAGYAHRLIKRYEREKIKAHPFKIKEWDYSLIANDYCALALTMADNGYMGLDSISLLDFTAPKEKTTSRMLWFTKGKRNLPADSAAGTIRGLGKQYEMTFRTLGDKRHLSRHMYDFGGPGKPLLFDIILPRPEQDSMVIATPFAEKATAFYYNQKINCMPADGRVIYDDKEYLFSPAASFGVLDWGRGVWTYNNTWYWSSASGIVDGLRFGFNFGYGFGDTSAASENMLFYDGIAHKLEEVQFHITMVNGRENYMAPWTITDNRDRVRLSFQPIIDRAADTNFVLLRSDQHQIFGRFSGTVKLDTGRVLQINNLIGFAEKVHNKW